eukprot:jgi/Bigna1/134064/aug1.23_g8772
MQAAKISSSKQIPSPSNLAVPNSPGKRVVEKGKGEISSGGVEIQASDVEHKFGKSLENFVPRHSNPMVLINPMNNERRYEIKNMLLSSPGPRSFAWQSTGLSNIEQENRYQWEYYFAWRYAANGEDDEEFRELLRTDTKEYVKSEKPMRFRENCRFHCDSKCPCNERRNCENTCAII